MISETIISEVQITPIRPQNGLIAFASFLLDQKFYVGGVGIVTKLNGTGYRLVFPTRKVGATNLSLFHPVHREVGEVIEKKVCEKVTKLFNESVKSYEVQ